MIRGLALGTLNEKTRNQFLNREIKMAASLSVILSVAGFIRAIVFKTGFAEAIAVTAALGMIVFSSICLGAILPIILEWIGVDPAHSSTSIQGKCIKYGIGSFLMVLSLDPNCICCSTFCSDNGYPWSYPSSVSLSCNFRWSIGHILDGETRFLKSL